MIRLKTKHDLEGIRVSCRLLARLHELLASYVQPGITTGDADKFIYDFIQDHGGTPAFLGYMGFPASSCISVNEQIIHGIPGKRIIQDADIVSIDIGINLKGYFSDAAQTLCMPETPSQVKKMVDVTRESLYLGVQEAVPGKRVSHIGKAVSRYVEQFGYSVVKEYCGHGVGFSQHEDPQVPNYPSASANQRLRNGMVLAIEPMVNMGKDAINHLDDNWTVITADSLPSAHWEHTVAVVDDSVEILTKW